MDIKTKFNVGDKVIHLEHNNRLQNVEITAIKANVSVYGTTIYYATEKHNTIPEHLLFANKLEVAEALTGMKLKEVD
jgi:hypothetical protein